MPVTAKLSLKFYEKFGEDVTNELVDWFNQVDAHYKSELKDLADAYFARFEAKLQSELGALRTELHSELGAGRGELTNARSALVNEINATRSEFLKELNATRSEFLKELNATRSEFATALSDVRSGVLKWMFIYWTGSVLATAAFVLIGIRIAR